MPVQEIDAGQGEYDYSVLGWCMAQMVGAAWGGAMELEGDCHREYEAKAAGLHALHGVEGWGGVGLLCGRHPTP